MFSLVWSGSGLLALGSVWCVRRLERRSRGADYEVEWRAYCLYLRPLIVTEFPGLLDRNRAACMASAGEAETRVIPLLGELLSARGVDFWWSCTLGLWLGMTGLLVLLCCQTNPGLLGMCLLPLGGFMVGPVLWSGWQALVLRLARLDPWPGAR